MGWRKQACTLAGLTLLTSIVLPVWPAAAQYDVTAGSDLYLTPAPPYGDPGPTHLDLALAPEFFGPGSDPFDGVIYFEGNPFDVPGPSGNEEADTIVERLDDAILPDPYASEDTVDTQMIALDLVSVAPITVSFYGGTEWSDYDVRMCLSGTEAQPLGSMTIRHLCLEGGEYDSYTPVVPKLIFTKVSGIPGYASRTLDPAPQLDFLVYEGCWSHSDPGYGIYITTGGYADHDCDGVEDVWYPPSSNFFATIRWVPCDGSGDPPTDVCKQLTIWHTDAAAQGVLAAEQEGPDWDSDGIHDLADNCPEDYNPYQEDSDNDCIGDACEQPTGACCLSHVSGTDLCQVMPEEDCLAAGGTYLGDDTDCGSPLGDPHYYDSAPVMDIPDNDLGGISDIIDVWDSCETGDVDVDICIHHPRLSDLLITLSHWDVTVTLWDGACGDNDSLGVIFDDQGNAVLCATSTVGNVDPTSTGGGLLSAFNGMEAGGSWTLTVVDQVSGQVGRLSHWSLHVDFAVDNPCVPPRGACCFQDDTCEVLTCEECYAAGGTYLGDFTLCEPNPCPCAPEGEPICSDEYVDTYNGGCDSDPPVFQLIDCGQRICGTSGTFSYQGGSARDTDWYQIEVAEYTQLTWTVQADFPVLIMIFEPGPADPCVDYELLGTASGAACDVVSVTACVEPGYYWLFIAPSVFNGVPCGAQYVAIATCEPCGACCFSDGSCQMLTAEACFAQFGQWQGPTVSCTPNPCVPLGACCLDDPVGGTVWCQVLSEAECLAAPGAWLGDGTDCGSPHAEVHVWEASPGLAIPDADPTGITHTIWADESCEVGDVDIDLVIHHTYLSDLLITVEHYGVQVVLWDGACGSNEHVSVIFDDEGNAVFCASPTMGSITPRSANGGWLSAFDGLEVAGEWTIRVIDQVTFDEGILYHWSVHVRFLEANPCVPDPRGACCLPDDECRVETDPDCAGLGGEFRGPYTLCEPNPCCEGQVRGDTDGNGSINGLDIDPFVEALVNPGQYNINHAPFTWRCTADINCDGSMNGLDIDPFVQCLTGGCPPCP